jgi:hypothetical protein
MHGSASQRPRPAPRFGRWNRAGKPALPTLRSHLLALDRRGFGASRDIRGGPSPSTQMAIVWVRGRDCLGTGSPTLQRPRSGRRCGPRWRRSCGRRPPQDPYPRAQLAPQELPSTPLRFRRLLVRRFRYLVEIEASKQRGSFADPRRASPTVGDWADDWLAAQADLSPRPATATRGSSQGTYGRAGDACGWVT